MQKNRKRVVREMIGTVVSSKMKETIVVRVGRRMVHPIFKKTIRKFNKFKVHNAKNEAKDGDVVRIREARPISKDKHWRLVEIIEKAT